jgi:redox-sensitive bicupin YhaK (pirin superfamily)
MKSFTALLLFCQWLNLMIDPYDAFVIQIPPPCVLDKSSKKFATRRNTRNISSTLLRTSRKESAARNGFNFSGNSLKHDFHELMLNLLVNSQRSAPPLLNSDILIDCNSEAPPGRSKRRRVSKLQRYERIPAWPLKNGIQLQTIARLPGGNEVASRLEDRYGGMDCPNIFVNTDDISKTSPFLMLVHHNHSFDLYDPARWIEKSVIPEGFPSHAHRGMMTVTICLKEGGLIHRDSLGIKQCFGADANNKYCGKHTQALNFGAGVLHELMWDNTPSRIGQRIIRQEIYQIWVDLPSDQRMSNIAVDLLGGEDETPTVIESKGSKVESSTIVIAGSHKNHNSTMMQKSGFTILQVSVGPGKTWKHSSPLSFRSMVLYMRSGSAKIEGRQIPKHCTSFCSSDGEEVAVVADEKLGADFLFLSGQPLDQNVVARGSTVGESDQDIADFSKDYKENKMGKPWVENLTDAQWKMHVDRYPCEYDSE